MLIKRKENTAATPITMDSVSGVEMRVMVGRDDGAPTFAMRHFTVQPGGHTPRHSHNYEHEVYVVAGTAQVEDEGKLHTITAGDVLLVEANRTHQFKNISNEPFEFLCLVPLEFDCGGSPQAVPGS